MTALKAGDKVRVTRTRIAPDGTSEQAGTWTGSVLSAGYHRGVLTGVELSGAGCLGIGDVSLGREGTGRTVAERIEDEVTAAPAIPDCYRCGQAAAGHATGLPCPAPDPFWNCPEHQTEILWTGADEYEDHYECPAHQCTFGRWVS